MPALEAPMLGWWRSAFFVALAMVTWLSLTPVEDLPPIELWDKLAHALAFAALAALIHSGWPRTARPALWAILLGYGLATELLQLWVPGRIFSALDLVADALGIAAYAVAARLAPRHLPLGSKK